jgi:hypothetical protein
MTKDEALKLALEALEHLQPTALNSFYTIGARDKAINAIKQALAVKETDVDRLVALARADERDQIKKENQRCYVAKANT